MIETDRNIMTPKDPDTDATYEIDAFDLILAEALRERAYAVGDVIRPTRDNGFFLECTKAGRTGRYNPYSPRQANQVIRDGSTDWISRHPSEVVVVSIAAVLWLIDPAGELAVVAQSHSGTVATVTLTGGRNGTSYDVTARLTTSEGNQVDITIVVPVTDT